MNGMQIIILNIHTCPELPKQSSTFLIRLMFDLLLTEKEKILGKQNLFCCQKRNPAMPPGALIPLGGSSCPIYPELPKRTTAVI